MIPYLHKRQAKSLVRAYGFSRESIGIVGQTAQWTDWHRWTKCIPNAATPSNPKTGEPTDPVQAAKACSQLLREYIVNIQKSPRSEKLGWLGFAIHLIQDLAVHQGMTDEEHSARTLTLILNPDWSPQGYTRSRRLLERFMNTLREILGEAAFTELSSEAGAKPLSHDERIRVFGEKDFSVRSVFFGFFRKVSAYLHAAPERRKIRWDVDQVLNESLSKPVSLLLR